MTTINVPTRQEVSSVNRAIFDNIEKRFGVVPNLFATMAHSGNALSSYMALQSARSTISGKAREVVNLVVSQVNECEYCLAAHTVVGKMSGLSDEQIVEIRRGRVSFDSKLDAPARLTQGIVRNRGHVDPALVDAFFDAGWTKENLVDTIVAIGDKTITNYLHSTTKILVDFPAAPALD
ncbi:carboxymuconolactone decarboxylase family protein [Paraburkholderia caledonica]|uniref:carboxymuconolactone decarboxylase family protein n=1 Tax=Paraburkholderia caledonica TaxID=134536 RepID=UPI000B3FBF11|nr:carboxymuconolactone decarboxylase family protein [Paraburkholderia caledonica]